MSFIDDVIRRSRTVEPRDEEKAELERILEENQVINISYRYDTLFQLEHAYHPIGTVACVSETKGVYIYNGREWERIGLVTNIF